mmetsp:Transcript_17228/g.24254  ORF Transcript_17228/g.24254 Transcript_17228/m.24254 type:complete len:324 (-) Transcript_17228:186-1157(-)
MAENEESQLANQLEDTKLESRTTSDLSVSRAYLRTSDLKLSDALKASSREELTEHGVVKAEGETSHNTEQDEAERWIALDDAQPANVIHVIDELVNYALALVEDKTGTIWTADKKTAKLMSQGSKVNVKDVWMWIGSVPHTAYGHDIPCVKSEGLVNMSPKHIAELLMDSSKVKSYNKHSQGRSDKVAWQTGIDTMNGTFGNGETKVTKSSNKAPLIRKPLEFICLMHARRITDDELIPDGSYVVVARTVSGPVTQEEESKPSVQNEVLLNVHLLKAVEGNPNQTDMININHLKSPLVPMMVAKKVGLASASGFLHDIRSLSK